LLADTALISLTFMRWFSPDESNTNKNSIDMLIGVSMDERTHDNRRTEMSE
jgi:hypothetical protein